MEQKKNTKHDTVFARTMAMRGINTPMPRGEKKVNEQPETPNATAKNKTSKKGKK